MELEINNTGFYNVGNGIIYNHSHDNEYEITLYKENGRLLTNNGMGYQELKNRIFLSRPKEEHSLAFLEGTDEYSASPMTLYWVTFSVNNAELDKRICEAFESGFLDANLTIYKKLDEIILKFESKNKLKQTSMNYQFLSMLYDLFTPEDHSLDLSADDSRVIEAIAIMKSRVSESLTVEELAKELKLNKNYFFSYFKKRMGISPMQYYMDLKLVQAANFLLNTNWKLQDIAEFLKFYDISHLSRQFKRKFGKSPLSFRK